jgi:hypothetical protein
MLLGRSENPRLEKGSQRDCIKIITEMSPAIRGGLEESGESERVEDCRNLLIGNRCPTALLPAMTD